ncbi:MAG: nitrogenase component 1 [Clostridiales bacterium]|nr:nitrogenase component 1 [Clostridiales bacterium]
MKRLWKVLPPCLSDLMGFEAVVNETEGMGLIDDSSTYKPLMFGRGGHGRPEAEGRHGHGGGRGGFGRLMPGMRVLNSDIRNEDIITGTEQKVMLAFDKGVKQLSPNFVLLAYGPSASMIGSDLEYAAEKITEGSAFVQRSSMDEPASLRTERGSASVQNGLPAAAVKIDGEKDYLYGISCTLEAMGRLLLTPRPAISSSLNILGANTIDWAKEAFADLEALLMQEGFQILSRWGWKETTENLKLASAAALNLVVNESGLRLARYMESEYGIPYLAGAPFGADFAVTLKIRLKEVVSVTDTEHSGEKQRIDVGLSESAGSSNEDQRKENDVDTEPEILIVGEQFMANAIRRELLRRGKTKIRVLSFYDMDRAYMETGDQKLIGEDDFTRQANAESVRIICADGDLRPLVKKEVRWVQLPNTGSMFPAEPMEVFNMTGGALDAWLDREGL